MASAGTYLQGHRLVLFDHIGCGASDLFAFDPGRQARLIGYAEDLGEVLKALDLLDATLVGHSVGCLISLMAAIAAPDRIASLIMVCPSPSFLVLPGSEGGFEQADIEGLTDLMDTNYIG